MYTVVKVKTLFDNTVKDYRISSDIELKKGQLFIATTCFGEDIVELSCPKRTTISKEKWNSRISGSKEEDKKNSHFSFEPEVLRVATDEEFQTHLSSLSLAETHRDLFQQKIEEYNMDMKIVKLYYTSKKDRLICTYTANQRVDFRELVRNLGSQLKQRVELFQISLKDVFMHSYECGACGRVLCCSIRCDVDNQDKKNSPRSAKMLGICGKAKCCLFFD